MAHISGKDKDFLKKAFGVALVTGVVVAPAAMGTAALIVLGVGIGTIVIIRAVQ